jgi:hypothetical protein
MLCEGSREEMTADIFTNVVLASFFSTLIVMMIRNLHHDIKNSSRSVEDATPQTQTKENK